jgi:hypothetical protein
VNTQAGVVKVKGVKFEHKPVDAEFLGDTRRMGDGATGVNAYTKREIEVQP